MTIQGAICELNNMLSSNDIPCYWKPAIKKIIETVEQTEQNVGMCQQNVGEMSEKQTDGDLISRKAVIDIVEFECGEWKGLAKTIVKAIKNVPSIKTDGDLIPRQSVITMLNKIENVVEDGDGFQFNEWIYYAKHIPSAEKMARWILVSERLPKEDEFVLVTFGWLGNKEDLAVSIDRIRDGEWELSEFVTAWMPLPDPYMEREEEENDKNINDNL